MHGEIDLRPGDVIKARRFQAFWHYGIYEGFESVIVHCAGRGIVRQTLNDFACGAEMRRVDRFSGERYDHAQTLRRARGLIGLPFRYDLFRKNCEHFARWCATGAAESRQVDTLATAASVAASALLAITQKPIVVIAAAAFAGLAAVEYAAARESARVPVGPVG